MAMSDPEEPIDDDDNPEWTEEDFAKALPYDQLPEEIKRVFGRAPERRPVAVRALEHENDAEGLTPNKRGYK
ncbi:hypothetical protein [Salinarimonas chemoclinalis]|uniref:hypothetical protein n=1 Tax=Salinarimonas chemoclinalis TaxID=3241599 RepID=UPI0035574043